MRHPQFDYTSTGAYFVTICVSQRICLFGTVSDGVMCLNELGRIACEAWPALAGHHADFGLDAFVVMPNHVHALLWLQPGDEHPLVARTPHRTFGGRPASSLPVLVGAYKSSVTQKVRRRRLLPVPELWQRNFYDNIVRDDCALAQFREYIRQNPARWCEDLLHPAAAPNRFNRD
jgi:putative transposase